MPLLVRLYIPVMALHLQVFILHMGRVILAILLRRLHYPVMFLSHTRPGYHSTTVWIIVSCFLLFVCVCAHILILNQEKKIKQTQETDLNIRKTKHVTHREPPFPKPYHSKSSVSRIPQGIAMIRVTLDQGAGLSEQGCLRATFLEPQFRF